MSAPIFDFSHLTPAERIELAEQLWDSLEPAALQISSAQEDELRRRRQELREASDPGEPWGQALDDIEERGA